MEIHYTLHYQVAELLQQSCKQINPQAISVIIAASGQTGTPVDIIFNGGQKEYAYERHLIRYALYEFLGYQPSQIKRFFIGGRTAAIHSIKTISSWSDTYPYIKTDLAALQNLLTA